MISRLLFVLATTICVAASAACAETELPPNFADLARNSRPPHPSRDKAMASAGQFVYSVLERHGIPELRPDDHGSLSVFSVPFSESGPVRYPISFLVQIEKKGEKAVYRCMVERKTPRSKWHFTQAWKQEGDKWVADLSLPK